MAVIPPSAAGQAPLDATLQTVDSVFKEPEQVLAQLDAMLQALRAGNKEIAEQQTVALQSNAEKINALRVIVDARAKDIQALTDENSAKRAQVAALRARIEAMDAKLPTLRQAGQNAASAVAEVRTAFAARLQHLRGY